MKNVILALICILGIEGSLHAEESLDGYKLVGVSYTTGSSILEFENKNGKIKLIEYTHKSNSFIDNENNCLIESDSEKKSFTQENYFQINDKTNTN